MNFAKRLTMNPPVRFIYMRYIESEFYILKALIKDAIAENIRKQAGLDNWIRVANLCNIALLEGFGYLDLCEFWRAALLKATNDYIKQQNDAQKEVMRSIESKMEKDVPHRSVLDSIPKPSSSIYR